MLRIRHLYDAVYPRNITAVKQIEEIFLDQFPGSSHEKFQRLLLSLKDPARYGHKTVFFVAENERDTVLGFAVLSVMFDIGYGFLDYIATRKSARGGVGSSLYERVREYSLEHGLAGLLFECLPDDPDICKDSELIEQNKQRLKFYEYYGVFPIIGTKYETPVSDADTCPPYMMYDDLGTGKPLSRETARKAIKTILKRKYANMCDASYIRMVVESIQDDPVRVREPRYLRKNKLASLREVHPNHQIVLVVNRIHAIHHVKERGYVESPVRIKTILEELQKTNLFQEYPTRDQGEKILREIHDHGYIDYLKKISARIDPNRSVYPYVFPIRNNTKPPHELEIRAGYYCIDTFTPLNGNAYKAAKGAVDTALTAAHFILEGRKAAYALTRPPGHHAERRVFGGFCYFNSAAACAQFLSRYGRVAILDVDFHHGNGQQDIFYTRSDVLTLSIHCHPNFAYPYFSGFKDEIGEGEGKGFNENYPLPEKVDGEQYREALKKALARIRRFRPRFLIVCLGLDTAKGDPTGSWMLTRKDFEENGRLIGALGLPTLVVQEGGYDNRVLGVNARHFFQGLAEFL
ncbi:MAG: hypothetical protein Kow009_06800 [Spirochaetales bacterium]